MTFICVLVYCWLIAVLFIVVLFLCLLLLTAVCKPNCHSVSIKIYSTTLHAVVALKVKVLVLAPAVAVAVLAVVLVQVVSSRISCSSSSNKISSIHSSRNSCTRHTVVALKSVHISPSPSPIKSNMMCIFSATHRVVDISSKI